MKEFKGDKLNKFFWKYEEALKFLENLVGSFMSSVEASDEHNPIEHCNGRIKSLDSINDKLMKRGLEFNEYNIENNLMDVAGIRIVCHFMNDLDRMIELIHNNPFIQVIEEKDYINNPKASGYSSYHMIVRVPVVDNDNIIYVPAEVQIRTLAMDLYASLEHKTRYKKDVELSSDMNKTIEAIRKRTVNMDMDLKKIIDVSFKDSKTIVTADSLLYDLSMSSKVTGDMLEKYNLGLNNLKCIINEIFSGYSTYEKNSIEDVKFRLKRPKSICKKLISKGILDIDEESIDNNLNDVIGGRIVCSFLSDMNAIIESIVSYFGPDNVIIKDYVSNPKPSGYSSYHILVKVPVYYKGGYVFVNAEIQIRTKAMNMWASFHHKLCYKKETSLEIEEMLRRWAYKIGEIDSAYDSIYQKVKNDIGMDKPKCLSKVKS